MRRFSFLIVLGILACAETNTEPDSNLKVFRVVGNFNSTYDVQFALPKSFMSIEELLEEQKTDTINQAFLNIVEVQQAYPAFTCIWDTIGKKLNVCINAGPRVDISNKPRNLTYFSIPATPLSKIFPNEDDVRKIIFDSGEMKEDGKTFYKRKFRVNIDSLELYQDFYYITTKWQSVLVVVNSDKEIDMDQYILNYTIISKEKK